MSARVGLVTVTLRLHRSNSLKEKRQIMQSLLQRVRTSFNVSIAEIERLDDWHAAVVAAALVSNDGQVNNAVLCRVVEALGRRADVSVEDYRLQIL